MKKFLQNRKGVIALVTMLLLMGVAVLGIGTVITSQLSYSAANNYRKKIETYNAADGVMTLLAQDMLDFNDNKYFTVPGPFDSLGANTTMGSGNSPTGGSYVYNLGTQTLTAGGADIQGTSDNLRFAYNTMVGNCDLTVKVVSMTNPSGSYGWAKAGIMIRQSLNSNSQYVMAIATPANGVTFQSRKNAGDTTRQTIISSVSVPVWLELKRIGNIFTVAYSTNDISWTTINKDTIAMTDPVYAGLAVTSHTTSTLEPAVFSNFSGVPQTFIDTVKIGKDSVPVIYTVTKLGANLFNMSTDAYFLKGTNSTHNYETQLNQLLSRQTQGTWTETARDSAIIPVTLYDFRSDNSSPEFQVPGQGMKNMLQCTLDVDRKPIPQIPLASFRSCILATYTGGAPYCFGSDWYTVSTGTRNTRYLTIDWHPDCINNCKSSNPPGNNGWWFNDSMRAWFRPWGDPNPMGGGYTYDPLSGKWSGLKMRPNWTPNFPGEDTEWVGQNWDSTNHFANIVMYDSLTFRQQKAPKDTTVFTFGDSSWIYKQDSVWFVKGCNCTLKVGYWVGWWDTITMYFPPNEYKFMPLKNRGFKYDASKWFPKGYNSCVDKCNFSYTMEIHRKFTYKPGQTFYFRGDDDVWGYINNHCVIDIGGTHTVDSENVMLDTIHPTLVSGQEYWFDFFYCERNVDKSNIYISTNMLMFIPPQPLKRSWKRNYGNLD